MANTRLVSNHVLKILELLSEDSPNPEEYMLIIANLLFHFGLTGEDAIPSDLDVKNANKIELTMMSDPNNVYLASLLQAHILIKWSESLRLTE